MKLDEAIMKRASVRYFKDDPVSDEEIRALIEAAIRAPTASGLENWLFVVFKSEEVRKEIYDLIGEGMVEYYRAVNLPEEKIKKLMKRIYEEGMYRAPAYIAVFIDRRVRFLKGREFDEVEFIWSVESAAMAIQNLMLKAVELGLGTVYIGVTNFRGIEEKVRELAGLDENYYLVGLIPVGRPRDEVKPRRRKKGVEEVTRIL
ncbi:NAD(P)H-flavin oxidoreductase [Thermococcus kodakarensis KOD1]|uniref:NAD(P)H-flavin oxidoreductase n=1 Tax=Thermococcus kodakarensis (strain ATCC BAA-918 / JCM 12380 / KOD1) TaxID=69014 RepID=Q5JCX9_THEKO|nr:nitroreductase family protein [Thermococcus kodakarensis]WCN28441.1 nitroreductase family protein [Thermococcus kodakarensis]WCN30737.1 nitroreductase family protein [Thermococcus kodakarensis]BAD84559.1 NAD(P)H-flavin oxidoreductase [Thermococcus kodakarensis KOD1]